MTSLNDMIMKLHALRAKGVETVGTPTTENSIPLDDILILLMSQLRQEEDAKPAIRVIEVPPIADADPIDDGKTDDTDTTENSFDDLFPSTEESGVSTGDDPETLS